MLRKQRKRNAASARPCVLPGRSQAPPATPICGTKSCRTWSTPWVQPRPRTTLHRHSRASMHLFGPCLGVATSWSTTLAVNRHRTSSAPKWSAAPSQLRQNNKGCVPGHRVPKDAVQAGLHNGTAALAACSAPGRCTPCPATAAAAHHPTALNRSPQGALPRRGLAAADNAAAARAREA